MDIQLTIEQVAEQLQVSTKTVRRMIDSGALYAVKAGGQIRIPPDALDALPPARPDHQRTPDTTAA